MCLIIIMRKKTMEEHIFFLWFWFFFFRIVRKWIIFEQKEMEKKTALWFLWKISNNNKMCMTVQVTNSELYRNHRNGFIRNWFFLYWRQLVPFVNDCFDFMLILDWKLLSQTAFHLFYVFFDEPYLLIIHNYIKIIAN